MTFRALDIVIGVRDGVIARLGPVALFTFLLLFPTVSAGPIDRYRRFAPDWRPPRTRVEFLADLDSAVHHLFRGLLYTFMLRLVNALAQATWHGDSLAAWLVTCTPTAPTCSSTSPDTALSPSH